MTHNIQNTYDRPDCKVVAHGFKLGFVLALIIVTYSSVIPFTGSPSISHIDKLQHAGAYASLTVLLGLGWTRLKLIWIGGLLGLYGGAVEVTQALTPYGRTGSWLDGGANILGVLAIVLMWSLWVRKRQPVRK